LTQIRSMIQPMPRRPGELGVHSLDHFSLLVPDVAEAEKFYGVFGLSTKEEGGRLALFTHGLPHRWGTVAEGPRKKLNYISFGTFEDDMSRFRERLERMRIERLDPPKGFETNGLWFRDPDGTLIELHVAEKSSSDVRDEGG
jgi:catechol 2,3-dioxygenase-like lactoylglutathione lyase family enzyme